MNETFERGTSRSGEHGGARLKFLIVMLVIGAVAYSSYLFLPVAYDSYLYKDLMQHHVDVAVASGYPPNWVKEQLVKSAGEYHVPADAVITPSQAENRVVVRVQFTRPIEFPGYTYNYDFDYTAKSTAFLTFK
jgi:hypothetical protein